MSRMRFWQEAALRAMQAFIVTNPPQSLSTSNIEQYAIKASRFAFEVAEQMHKNHGPNVDPELRT